MDVDREEAYKWFLLAQINGLDISDSLKSREDLMTAEQIAEVQRRAREFVPKKEDEKK